MVNIIMRMFPNQKTRRKKIRLRKISLGRALRKMLIIVRIR
jgi:hypothetical protein